MTWRPQLERGRRRNVEEIELSHPIQVRGREVRKLTLRQPKFKDIRKLARTINWKSPAAANESTDEALLKLLLSWAGIPEQAADQVDPRDREKFGVAAARILNRAFGA